MKEYFTIEKENLLNYIRENFNIDKTSYLLIDSLYDILEIRDDSRLHHEKIYFSWSYEEIDYYNYLHNFIETLNNCNIDISMIELIENGIATKKEC